MAVTLGKKVVGMVLAGGLGEGLGILAEERTIAAMPFAGKYRVIDFTLSNLVNSGIDDVGVLLQYRPHSLIDHLGIGKPWDLDRLHGGLRILQPYLGDPESTWYRGTADAVYQNIPYLEESDADVVLILMGDQVYKRDYREIIVNHLNRGATLTLAVRRVPREEVSRFGIVETDSDGKVTSFVEKPEESSGDLASVGIYVFDRRRLVAELRDARRLDFGREVIPHLVSRGEVHAVPFNGYWRDVGLVDSYYRAHMDLLGRPPAFELYHDRWTIYTRSEERPPARVGARATIDQSLICHGCRIEGTVIRSVLSPGVRVAAGAVVRDSVILTDSIIGTGSTVDHCILDKEVEVGDNCRVGAGDDRPPNDLAPNLLVNGLTIAGKRATIPDGVEIGRNCLIGIATQEADFPNQTVPSGTTILSFGG